MTSAQMEVELHFEDGQTHRRVVALPCEIGRAAPHAGIALPGWRVARRHARLTWRAGQCHMEDFGALSGTWLNGKRVARHAALHAGDVIIIGPCRMRILSLQETDVDASVAGLSAAAQDMPSESITSDGTDGRGNAYGVTSCEKASSAGSGPVTPARVSPAPMNASAADASECPADHAAAAPAAMASDPNVTDLTQRAWAAHGSRLHAALLQALDLRRRDVAGLTDMALRAEAASTLETLMRDDPHLPTGIDRQRLAGYLLDEAVGLGPLEPLLADPDITEIMVNRHDEIYVERRGKLTRHHGGFTSERAVLGAIERIVAPLGRRIDESAPMVDARLRDGSRVNAVIAPVALRGASLTIRKFSAMRPGMNSLLARGALDAAMCQFLDACVKARRNIIVSGGTGSGKTTLLNALSNCIPEGERIITIEDAAELRLAHAHLVSLESRPPNLEGKGSIAIRDLVRNALRMRPDRIVVGECRGAEAFDMLTAMNTGHEGSLTTLHANSARDALARLETMILLAGLDLPLGAVREHIAASIDLIVQQARLPGGRRIILSISEITGMESGRIQLQELFHYQDGVPPVFAGCGVMPQRCRLAGMTSAQIMTLCTQRTPLSAERMAGDPMDEASCNG